MAEKLTKAERREIAREKARVLQAEQEKREKRNRTLMIGGIVALLALVGIAIWAIVSSGGKSYLDGIDGPANADNRGGISIGSSLEAGTVNEGAPVLNVYADFTCHWCATFEDLNAADLEDMTAEGLITLSLHPVSLLTAPDDYNVYAANALATVAEYSPEHVLQMNSVLFAAYYEVYTAYQESGDANDYVLPTRDEVGAMALELGVPQDVVDRFADGEFTEWVQLSTQQFLADGNSGTPTIILDGEKLGNEIYEEGGIRALVEDE